MQIHDTPVQLRGSALAVALLRLAGWQVRFRGLPGKQGVAIVYPHTSNWDFVVGILAKWAIGIDVHFWGKDSLFRVPLFGRWLRWVGGIPVDRRAANGMVGQMAQALADARREDRFLWLAVAPEGTRSRAPMWRSGFYHVATAAQVPLLLAYFDFADRVIGADHFVLLSGNAEADMAEVRAYLQHRVGKRPLLAAPIEWKT